MNTQSYILLADWSVISNVWLGLWIAQSIAKRRGLILQPEVYRDDSPPTVTIIVPACDEDKAIGSCLDYICQQDYPNWRAIVVDDRSRDATAQIVEECARWNVRISLQRITDRPDGWMGKSYALWHATRGLETDWLLFIDADCHLEPAAVSSSLREAEKRRCDMLTLWPRHRGGGFWEHLLIPLLGGVIALWFGTANRRDLTRGPGFANGQFVLIRRKAYERVGGHEAVRQFLIEDIPFAAHAKRNGLRCWAGGGARLFSVRMYDSLKAIQTGWVRILFGALRSRLKVMASILWILFGSLFPFVALPILIFQVMQSGTHTPAFTWMALTICISHLTMIAMVSYRFWGWGGCDRRYLLLYPFSAAMVLWVLTRCLFTMTFNRQVSWRGTHYTLTPKAVIIE